MAWTEQQLTAHLERTGVPGAPNRTDVSVRPFDPFIGGIVLDLPPPISVNRIWRRSKAGMIKSSAYQGWIKRADGLLLELGQTRGVKPIAGPFTALIVVRRTAMDLDNSAKCLLDFLQSRSFIADDKLCEELTLRWGEQSEAPTGSRVTVRPLALSVNGILEAAASRLEGAQP